MNTRKLLAVLVLTLGSIATGTALAQSVVAPPAGTSADELPKGKIEIYYNDSVQLA